MQARILTLAGLLVAATAAPAFYDQRQDGELNVAADVQNVVLLFAYPQKMSVPLDFLDDFLKSNKPNSRDSQIQERADHVMEAFVEPSTPYRVEIGTNDRGVGGDGRAVEVVIAGRTRLGPEPQNENDTEEEIKLIGAQEQCGPDRERDPVTLTCRFRVAPDSAPELQQEPEKDKVISELTTLKDVPQVVSS